MKSCFLCKHYWIPPQGICPRIEDSLGENITLDEDAAKLETSIPAMGCRVTNPPKKNGDPIFSRVANRLRTEDGTIPLLICCPDMLEAVQGKSQTRFLSGAWKGKARKASSLRFMLCAQIQVHYCPWCGYKITVQEEAIAQMEKLREKKGR